MTNPIFYTFGTRSFRSFNSTPLSMIASLVKKLGSFLPCSQFLSVFSGMPTCLAKSGCVFFKSFRSRLSSLANFMGYFFIRNTTGGTCSSGLSKATGYVLPFIFTLAKNKIPPSTGRGLSISPSLYSGNRSTNTTFTFISPTLGESPTFVNSFL